MNIVFNPIGGMSGDMTLAALLNAMPDKSKKMIELVNNIPLEFDFLYNSIQNEQNIKCGQIDIKWEQNSSHRNLEDIIKIVDNTNISGNWKNTAVKFFSTIANVEAEIHNTTPEKIHFHEIGAIDSIVDILGTTIILDYLSIEDMFFISPLPVGNGMINTAHGKLPSFAPATAKLLEGKPLEFLPISSEMITPTGALFLHFSSLLDKPVTTIATGYGSGKRTYDNWPNILRVFLSETDESIKNGSIIELETNIDDMSPQSLSVFYQMIGSSALDVFITPIIMKKSRPGYKITVITSKSNLEAAKKFIFSNSTTTGIRYSEKPRFIEKRIVSQISTPYGIISAKLLNSKVIPEFEDCLQASKKSGIPVYKIIEEVRQIATTKN